jgi:hypothetical protein
VVVFQGYPETLYMEIAAAFIGGYAMEVLTSKTSNGLAKWNAARIANGG